MLGADIDTIFRKDTGDLWEELTVLSRRIRAALPMGVRPAG